MDRHNPMIERAAQAIYEQHAFGLNESFPIQGKPAWTPHGNSLKQDEARQYAIAAIAALSR
jgi:hypothetical protein